MTYGSITCERLEPAWPEAYVCRWEDRNKLALMLLSDGKASKTRRQESVKGAKGLLSQPYAVVMVIAGDV